jgi:hypothetical protein
MKIFNKSVVTLLFILIALPALMGGMATSTSAQVPPHDVAYRYYFVNEKFVVSIQEVLIDAEGQGRYRFKKKDMEEMSIEFNLSPRVLNEIRSLVDQLSFLTTEESFQHRKDFSHLGTMSIRVSRGAREREVTFNYTDNPLMNQLVQIFRGVTVQESRIFEMELVRSTDPISMPAQLRYLESELKSRNIADPQRFGQFLNDLKSDESVPLIARNHAGRLLQMIERSKQGSH